jgi:hypothetical protein
MVRARLGWLCLLGLFCGSFAAEGHQLDHPKSEEITVHPGGVSVVLRYQLPPGNEARILRAEHDQNRDGLLSHEEAAKLEKLLTLRALSALALRLDEERLTLNTESTVSEGIAGPRDRSEAMGVALVLSAKLPISAGLHVLEVRDRGPRPGTSAEAAVRFAPGLSPVIASAGQLDFVARSLAPVHLDGSARLSLVFVGPEKAAP